jgi:aryl-alcohol dehydrogenase-like predicted oxidoreductase
MSGAIEEAGRSFKVPYRVLGRTGLHVSSLAFGAGPVSGLMTGDDVETQAETIEALYKVGINWIDTAAGYGNGSSEKSIGHVLAMLPNEVRPEFHVATKVRIDFNSPLSFADQIRFGVDASLQRLQLPKVRLVQLHNGVTARRGDQPSSVGVADVLDSGGILDALKSAQADGQTDFLGLTGTGAAKQMQDVVKSTAFDTIQVPYNLLNPSAGKVVGGDFGEQNYGNILDDCRSTGMGCFAIRVFAGGALLRQPPGNHTLKTPYFPLDLYRRDLERAASLDDHVDGAGLDGRCGRVRQSIEFALSHPAIHSAIIGFGTPEHVMDAVRAVSHSCTR